MVLEAAEGVLPRVYPTGLKAYKANARIPISKKNLAHRIVQKSVFLLPPASFHFRKSKALARRLNSQLTNSIPLRCQPQPSYPPIR